MRTRLLVVVMALAVLSSCQWLQHRGDASLAGVQTGETIIGVHNVSTLVERWRSDIAVYETPTVNGNRVHTTEGTWAVDVGPTCAGTPLVCPRTTQRRADGGNPFASATLAHGSSFVLPFRAHSSSPTWSDATLSAFDAGATAGCTGAPVLCRPTWTYTSAPYSSASPWGPNVVQGTGSPTVVGTALFAASTSLPDLRLYRFDATGNARCSGTPKVCQPLWATDEGWFPTAVAVGDDRVFAIDDMGYDVDATLRTYDVGGTLGCGGTPKVCQPLWTGDLGIHADGEIGWTSPVVDGIVYAIVGTTLFAFETDGGPNCTGTPVVCQPLWTAGVPGDHTVRLKSPAVAGGRVLVPTDGGVFTFDAAGSSGCAGTPTRCQPLAGYLTGSEATSATVANGVLYAGTDDGLFAFDLATAGCDDAGFTLCSPLWHALDGRSTSGPAVVNGRIHVAADGRLVTFGLP